MDQEEYLRDRLEDQIKWYDRKSMQNQKMFKRLQVVSIIASATIPFLVSSITETSLYLRIGAGAFAIAVAVITAVLNLYTTPAGISIIYNFNIGLLPMVGEGLDEGHSKGNSRIFRPE